MVGVSEARKVHGNMLLDAPRMDEWRCDKVKAILQGLHQIAIRIAYILKAKHAHEHGHTIVSPPRHQQITTHMQSLRLAASTIESCIVCQV